MKLTNVQKEIKRFTRSQKILISLITVLVLYGSFTYISGGNALSRSSYNLFTLLRYSIIEHPVETITEVTDHLRSLNGIRAENDELHAKVASSKLYQTMNDEKNRNIQELEKLMKFETHSDFEPEYASVISRDASTWNNFLVLNKGEKDGVKMDMAVISSKGLIGKVVEVYKDNCKVKLLTTETKDISVSVKIELKKGTTAGILENYDSNLGRYRVQIFDDHAKIEKGMKLITSGNGGVFPPGILIGKVHSIEQMYDTKGKIVTVTPSVNFNDFAYTAILKGK